MMYCLQYFGADANKIFKTNQVYDVILFYTCTRLIYTFIKFHTIKNKEKQIIIEEVHFLICHQIHEQPLT